MEIMIRAIHFTEAVEGPGIDDAARDDGAAVLKLDSHMRAELVISGGRGRLRLLPGWANGGPKHGVMGH